MSGTTEGDAVRCAPGGAQHEMTRRRPGTACHLARPPISGAPFRCAPRCTASGERGPLMPKPVRALIVVPDNNTTMEPEMAALCPALAPMPVARVKRPARTLTRADLPAYAEATMAAVD